MSTPWIAAGALLGGIAAIGLWFATGPREQAPSSLGGVSDQGRVPAHEPAFRPEGPDRLGDPARSTPDGERREAETEKLIGEPDFGVIGYGRVHDQGGEPVPGASPVFEDGDAFTFHAESGPGGSWTRKGLSPGTHEVRFNQRGFLPVADQITVPATRSWKRDFVLERGISLPVRFEDAVGEALELGSYDSPTRYLSAVATRERPGQRLRGVGAHAEGTFLSRSQRPPDLGPRHQGLLRLSSAPPLWISAVLRDVVLESRPFYGEEEELVFVVDPAGFDDLRGEVRVRVVDRDTGAPIVEHVTLGQPSGGRGAQPRNEGGTLVFSDLLPGTADLLLQYGAGGWEWLERSVDVPPGGSVDLGTISLGKSASFEVHIRDESGNPLVLRLATARPELAGSPSDLNQRVHVKSGVDGSASVTHLAPGPTLLIAGGQDGLARVARLVDTTRESEVELVVPRGVEVALRSRGDRVPGYSYVLEDGAGLYLYGGTYLTRDTFLCPGSYVLRVLDGEREVERVPFTVAGERVVVRYGGA